MNMSYPHVFTPGKIGPVDLANRIYFGPNANPLDAGGAPSEDSVSYFEERAAGGVGLIIHSLPVAPRGGIGRACPNIDESLPAFRAVADRVHRHGTKIFGQLHLFSHNNFQWEPRSPLAPSMSVSGMQRFNSYGVTREMTIADIDGVISAFSHAAANLRSAGYDGIEIHSTHGMVPETFLSPFWNRRLDAYGGDVDARMRFIIELLEAVRHAVGSEVAVGVRMQCDEILPGGMTQEDCGEVVRRLAELNLADFFDLDISVEPEQSDMSHPGYMFPKFYFLPYVQAVRRAAGSVSVLSCVGRLTDLADAERLIAEQTLDFVGMVRGLIAEPRLVSNARDGRADESRICIGANHCCERRMLYGGFGCGINPASGRERLWGAGSLSRATRAGKVVVVGGGPAGAEAARVARLRGHDVVLFEADGMLGGQLKLWAKLPDRGPVADVIPWYERQLERLGVDVRLNQHASVERVLSEAPDAVIVATGSRYVGTGESGYRPRPIHGADQQMVITPEDVLADSIACRGHVVILDDESLHTGVGIAELLATEGADVELVTRWMQPAQHLQLTLESDRVLVRLKSLGVTLTTASYITQITDSAVVIEDIHTGHQRVIESVDKVVLVTMRRQEDIFTAALESRVNQVFAVGDALAPRALPEATYEGQRFARLLGQEGAPSNFTEAFWEPIDAINFARPAAHDGNRTHGVI